MKLRHVGKNIFLVLALAALFIIFSQASAQDTFRDLDYKLAYDPTVCAIEPEESDIDEAGKTLLDQTRISLLDWQTKLRETSSFFVDWMFLLIADFVKR